MPSEAAQRYITAGRGTVPGWFDEQDAWLFAVLSDLQGARGIAGDLAEIGVYQGTSAILLGYLAGPDEHVILCDLFGDDPEAGSDVRRDLSVYDGLALEPFLGHWHRFHAQPPDEIVVGLSTELHDMRWNRPVRFIHIDGGHTQDVVRGDIQLAEKVLAPTGGVVVFDDIRVAGAPGVAAAVWGAVASVGLIPFAESRKLYATWDAEFAGLAAEAVAQAMPCVDHVVGGRRLVQVLPPPKLPPSFARRWTPPGLVPAASKARGSVQALVGRLRA